jgi:hypothetical protein
LRFLIGHQLELLDDGTKGNQHYCWLRESMIWWYPCSVHIILWVRSTICLARLWSCEYREDSSFVTNPHLCDQSSPLIGFFDKSSRSYRSEDVWYL